jgi:hypothetical protein
MAMASAWRCRSSSSAGVSFAAPPRGARALPIRLLRDAKAAPRCCFRCTQPNALPIGEKKDDTGSVGFNTNKKLLHKTEPFFSPGKMN